MRSHLLMTTVCTCLMVGCTTRLDRMLDRVVLKRDYTKRALKGDLATIRGTAWPKRDTAVVALERVFYDASFQGFRRDEMIELLGQDDGPSHYEDVPALPPVVGTVKEVRRSPSPPNMLTYSAGDGRYHAAVYVLHFAEGRLAEVERSQGY